MAELGRTNGPPSLLRSPLAHDVSLSGHFSALSLAHAQYPLRHHLREPLRHAATDQRPEYLSFRLLPGPAIHRVSQVFSVVVQTQCPDKLHHMPGRLQP